MAKTVINLVQFPELASTSSTPPNLSTAGQGWGGVNSMNSASACTYSTDTNGARYASHTFSGVKSIVTGLGDGTATPAGQYVAVIDAQINSGATMGVGISTAFNGVRSDFATAPATLVGDGTRKLYVVPFTAAATFKFMGINTGSGGPDVKDILRVYGWRLSPGTAIDDTLGVFSGGTAPTIDTAFSWSGTAYASSSTALISDPLIPVETSPVVFDDTLRTFTIPAVEHVTYKRGDGPILPGTYSAGYGEVVTVTATADEGYVIVGNSSWTYTYPLGPQSIVPRLMRVLGHDESDPEDVADAQTVVDTITLMARTYTRKNGFNGNEPNEDIGAVIFTASLRLLSNPSGLEYRAGNEQVTSAFNGWTLTESYVLNAYRKRQS